MKKGNQIKTNLPGKHQEKNARMVFEALRDRGMDEEKIRTGLMNIENPGRFEWLNAHTLVDTANNQENIKILQKMIKSLNIE